MSQVYFKAILRYGHVGWGKEVTVARYIWMDRGATIIDAMRTVSQMPGVKRSGIISIRPIDQSLYLAGKQEESNNFYLQQLFSHRGRKSAA